MVKLNKNFNVENFIKEKLNLIASLKRQVPYSLKLAKTV